jgi:hypothetical protein
MSSEEEELVNSPFYLGEGGSIEFVIGRIEQGDTLKILIDSDYTDDTYEVELFPISKELSRTLLALKVKSGKAVVYRVPFSVDVAIRVRLISGYRATHCHGNLRLSVIRAPSRVSRCPVCGAPVEPGAKYCGKCGAKLE